MGRTTVLEGLIGRVSRCALGRESTRPSTSFALEDAMSSRNTENPASGEDWFRLVMACILVAAAVFGLIHTVISPDTHIALAPAEAGPILPAF